jgi:hypothetical protein
MDAKNSKMLELPSDKRNLHALNKTFARFNSPTKNINIQSASPPNIDDQFYTPAPTPSTSKHSNLRLMPSISCKSNFSVQTFHTALGDSDDDDEENVHPHTKLETINEKMPLNTSNPVNDNGETSNIKTNNDHIHNMSRDSSTNNDLLLYHPTATPMAASTSSSFMIHPMSAVQSNASISNNFYYYGSLDSGMLSKSPAGSYFHDYFSEDYEVVLDDGTRQKRSVSLSTIPISTPIEFDKRKYKGHYNHFYYDQQYEDETDEQHRQRMTSKSEENE